MRFAHLLIGAVVLLSALRLVASDPAVQQFERNTEEYVQMRERVASAFEAKKKSDEPAEIEARRDALAAAIREERQAAKAGDVFTPDVKQYLLAIIRQQAKGDTKEATEDGNPAEEGKQVKLAVNGAYPENAPLSTMPASLLQRLPKLPKDLEYRFVGRSLILYDSLSGLIVDYIPDALRS
jgi:hypothetical protein